ncbi:MAG: carboxypeptidase regulatory-like domain-containing protein [Bacteroidetes bacterium]|nr:carboxypeptidase regulatory-like domain-containing protein [Bacteroidota bacterium]
MKILISTLLVFVCFICNYSPSIHAEAVSTGTITGKVTDGESGETLRGASVSVVGTKKGAYSDVKGKFTVKSIPVGTYSIRVSYVGFKPKIVDNIAVIEGQPATVDVVLQTNIKKTQEVVATARRTDDNQAAMLNKRKNSAQVSDGISEEEIAKLPDADAGQALKRVSGITLVGDKFVYVRGVSDRYNSTILNGASLATTEPDKKSFAFDMFPAEFLQNANVAKSFTPDLPGNFAGGLVQLTTIDFPLGFSLKASTSSSYNSNVTFKDNSFLATPSGTKDWLATDDGTRALPANAPSSRDEINQLLREAKNFYNPELQAEAQSKLQDFARGLNSNNWKGKSSTAMPNSGFGLSYTNIFNVADNDLGVIGSLTYSNGYSISVGRETPIQAGTVESDRYRQIQSPQVSTRSVNWGGLINLAYKIGTSSSISIKNLYNRSSDDEAVYSQGKDIPQGIDTRFYNYQYVQKSLYSGSISGEHTLPWENMLFDWRLGLSTSERDEPDFRRLRYSRQSADTTLPFMADISQTPQGDGTLAGRFFSNLTDKVFNGGANLMIPISREMKLKFGGSSEERTRSFTARSFTINQQNGFADSIDFSLSPEKLLVPENFRIGQLGISEDSKKSDSYSGTESLVAGYGMIDMPFEVFGGDFRFIGGMRLEDNTIRLNSFGTAGDTININYNTFDVLPSLNILFKATSSTNVRFSASQTLTRPTFREIAPFAFYDFRSLFVVTGNPQLKRTLIQNYDIRLETFPNPGEVLSIGAFYKSFKNPIEEAIQPTSSEWIKTFSNAESRDSSGKVTSEGIAYNYGIELEGRKSLSFLSESFSDFLLSVNYSLIRSEITVMYGQLEDTRPMWGQSPYTLNVGLFYVNPEYKTAVNVAYNRFGRRIVQVGAIGFLPSPHIYEEPRDVVDFSVIQPIADAFELKLAVRDIFNQEYVRTTDGLVSGTAIKGTTVNVGISYKFK